MRKSPSNGTNVKAFVTKSVVPSLPDEPKVGDAVEVSPEAWRIVNSLCRKVSRQDGAVLVIDYGNMSAMGDTLQASCCCGGTDDPGREEPRVCEPFGKRRRE